MISSVTTTVSTIVSSVSMIGLGLSIGIAAVLTLIAGLVIKELSTGQKTGFRILGRNLEITILPLLLVFLSIICTRVWGILS
ncbi:MAG: hypothetical protein ABR954_08415 [Dehalococcoidales bacterium]